MAYLFDTDAISELLRPRPLSSYVEWIDTVPREEQFTSAVVVGELYKGAYRSQGQELHLANIERRILPAVTVLPFDVATAKQFGKIRARLEETGTILPDADIQIAATAIYHDLELVSGNLRHFSRITELKMNSILADARADG
ncbi:MAG: type II toxin-antitoxin system VapC family toxin [Deltaproteobacteria bacterium]|jgi:predicted nucleic acid-binding protein|nr:type II toxin-antitoxin system VapC family toxin [Deltaproteobacteria bacterium]MBW2481751.1 type II toxin-antitoxin system VapC family toxin [Deltaproteobacteria bacterium]